MTSDFNALKKEEASFIFLLELVHLALTNGDVNFWLEAFQPNLNSWDLLVCHHLLLVGKHASTTPYIKSVIKRWEGKYWLQLGDWNNAIESLTIAMEFLPSEMRQSRNHLVILNELGQAHRGKGNYVQAVAYYQEALRMAIDQDNKDIIAQTQSNLGVIARIQGRINEAIEYTQGSLKYYEETHQIEPQIKSLNNLGIIYKNLADWESATLFYDKAIFLALSIHDQRTLGILYLNVGNCLYPQGKWDDAYADYEKALAVFTELKDQVGITKALSGLGIIWSYKQQWDQSEKFYSESVENARQLNDPLSLADGLHNLGIALANQNRLEEAEKSYQESLQLYAAIKHSHGLANVFNSLGRIFEKKQVFLEAQAYYQKSLEILQKTKMKWDELDTQVSLARILARNQKLSEAEVLLENISSEATSRKFFDILAWSFKEKGDLFLQLQKIQEAIENYAQALTTAQNVNAEFRNQLLQALNERITSSEVYFDELAAWLAIQTDKVSKT